MACGVVTFAGPFGLARQHGVAHKKDADAVTGPRRVADVTSGTKTPLPSTKGLDDHVAGP